MINHPIERLFDRLASRASGWMGSSWAFLCAVLLIVVWASFGPSFHYSDTWELIINTSTTIVTFLMVFLIQNSQNRDARALHLKLDELIVGIKHADNKMLNIERLSLSELEELSKKYDEIAARLRDVQNKKTLQRNSSLRSE